jgi:hypothetical protein
MKKFIMMVSLTLALMAAGVSSAGAEQLRVGEGPGQPVISGDLTGENTHGVIHCQPLVDLLLPGVKAPGVIVVHTDGVWHPVGPCAKGFEEGF